MSGPRERLVTTPGGRVAGEITVPGDKSISHRAALLGAIAEGTTEIEGFLEGDDCLATLAALAAMGIAIERKGPGSLRIRGAGPGGLKAPVAALDLGNSGTSMRLLAGLIAGQGIDAVLVGDASLMSRPMERVAAPLRRMGADVTTRDGRPPIVIRGHRRLRAEHHQLEVPSAQVKSALLLAGVQAEGRTVVREPAPSRDHTERMLRAFGASVEILEGAVAVQGHARLRATRLRIPGDFSSAAFFVVAALIAGREPLRIRSVGLNPTRTALLEILRLMGADIRERRLEDTSGEPWADLEVCPGPLRGVVVPESLVPVAMDELPVLFAAAAVAEGETVVTGAGELRVKESDRLAAMGEGLATLGVQVAASRDGLRVRGGTVGGGEVTCRGDHRVAMAFAVLGARAQAPIAIDDARNVATSFPGFTALARTAGLRFEDGA